MGDGWRVVSYFCIMRAIATLSSRSLIDWRLSYSFLPRATPMTSFTSPRSLMKSRSGMIVNPVSLPFFSSFAISFLLSSSLRSRRATWLL